MLRPRSSPAPWPGAPSRPCAKCGAATPGLVLGALCSPCLAAAHRRAARIGRWVAVGTSLPLAGYVTLTMPPDRTARLVAAAAVVIWYALTSLIARRVAVEWLT